MNFYCANTDFKKADIIICGVPYDGTSSFRPGSRFAPDAARSASYQIESYSPYQQKDLRNRKICDMGNIPLPFGDKELALNIIESFTKKLISRRKKLIAIGGEHLISLPVIKNYRKLFSDLAVIQLDAHSDLINSYRGEKLSHATVMRRVAEIVGFDNLYQIGIRSCLSDDLMLPKRKENMCMFDFSKSAEYIENLRDRHIYLTIDLDVLDPSIFPGTGTPEPGGVTYKNLIDLLKRFETLNIVGADIVELSPHYDLSGVSSIVAASVIREIALLI